MRKFLVLGLFFLPCIAQGAVLINEIAWMGTQVNANDEWIELYNNGSEPVNLDGWSLSDNVSLEIPLVGSISAGAYALLERTDDTSVPEVGAFLIYTGALANDGRTLTLFRPDASIEDQIAGGENWGNVGGDNATKNTAQRVTSGWVTAAATPGGVNGDTDTDEEVEVTEATTTSSSGGTSSSKKAPSVKLAHKETVLELTLNAPSRAYANQVVTFEVVPKGAGKTVRNSLVYHWNFGDTYTAHTRNPIHSFAYPGEYIVVVEATFAQKKALIQHEITILPITLELARSEGGDILLHNNAKYDVDISGYQLHGTTFFVFPEHTILKAGGTLTISLRRVDAREDTSVSLYDTERRLIIVEATHDDRVEQEVEIAEVSYTAGSEEENVRIPIGAQRIQSSATTSGGYGSTAGLSIFAGVLGLLSLFLVVAKMKVPA